MIRTIQKKIESRVAYRLAFWVIIFSTLITLLVSVVQIILDYRSEMNALERYFQSIPELQLETMSQAVWVLDDNRILAQLHGIMRRPEIVYAGVMVDGNELWSVGVEQIRRPLSIEYPLQHVHRDQTMDIGTLRVVADLKKINAHIIDRLISILLMNLLKTLLFAGCILFFFQFAVTRHLEKLAAHMNDMDFKRKLSPLKLDRRFSEPEDEFSQAVNMLNFFQRRAHHAFSALEKSEMRLRLFFDATDEGIFGINKEGRITFLNLACRRKFGKEMGHGVIGMRVDDLFAYTSMESEDQDLGEWSFYKSMETGLSQSSEEGVFEVAGGATFHASIKSYPILVKGKSTGAVFLFNDISERLEVIREKNLLSHAIRQSPLVVMIADHQGRLQYVNPGFEQQSGLEAVKVLGKRSFFLPGVKEPEKTLREIKTAMFKGEKWQNVFTVKNRDGKERRYDLLISPVINKAGELTNAVVLGVDITQNIELQQQLNHVHKMEAVGRLAANFAHEFGNPLLGVRSVIRDISDREMLSDEDRHLLKVASAECERMKILIRDFQQFQRSGTLDKSYCDIHKILDNVLFFYRKHFKNNRIKLVKEYGRDIPDVYICKDQVGQVFLNLIINAVDAMSENGGVLTVASRVFDGSLVVWIRDTGYGIDKEQLQMIFEPFFTTKQEVQGTGLGLSISYSIIVAHGGDITVSSEIGEGTEFLVQLPLNPDDAPSQQGDV